MNPEGTESHLNSEENKRIYVTFRSLVEDGTALIPDTKTETGPTWTGYFPKGNIGIMPMPASLQGLANSSLADADIGVTLIAGLKGGQATLVGGVLSFRDARVETFVSGDMPFNGLTQYQQVMADPVFWKVMSNTVLFTFLSILFQFTIGFLLGLFFQVNFRLRNLCFSLLLIPWVMPLLTSAITFKGLFNELGPVNQICRAIGLGIKPWLADPNNGLAAVIVPNIWIGFPFNFVLIYAGIRAIPQEIYEAAKLDGAAYWGRVFHKTVPILKPVTIAVLMRGTIYTVKVFDLVWIMTGGGPGNGTHLLSTYAYQTGFSLLNFGQAAAIGTVIVLLILAINSIQFLLQRIL